MQEDEYYAFGLRKSDYDYTNNNRHLYNGKELQVDLANQYDYGARFYDPVIGRFSTVDPMATTLHEISPYVYVRDNPVLRIDREGLWDITVHAYKDREKYGYGVAVVTDRHGKEVYSFQVRLEGTGGRNRRNANSDTPTGVYDIPDHNMWNSGGSRAAYGPNPRLILNPESGEIVESGRDLIRIHGGRQEVYNQQTGLWEPVKNADLKKTHGCMRCSDMDVKTLKEVTDGLMNKDSKEVGGKLTVVDDLVETKEDNPIPFTGTSTTYKRPGENATKEEKQTWSNLLKSLFGN